MIKIGLVSQVSAGKTTALNSILGKYYGQTGMRRTTKKVFSFQHDNNIELDDDTIKQMIELTNNNTENQTDFILNIPIIKNPELNYIIYDFPGFNDGLESINGMEKLFFDKLPELDYVIYLIDSNNALIHKTEKDLITNIISKINNNHKNLQKYTKIYFVFNKYDDDISEISEMCNDATTWINQYTRHLLKNSVIFNRVSFRNMMVKRILEFSKNKKIAFQNIPVDILLSVFTEFYGKHKSRELLKKNKITKKQLNNIVLTYNEHKFFDDLKLFTTKKYNIEWRFYHFENLLKITKENTYSIINNDVKFIVPCNKIQICKQHISLKELDYSKYYNLVIDYIISDLCEICINNISIKCFISMKNTGNNNMFSNNEYHNINIIKIIELIKYITNVLDIKFSLECLYYEIIKETQILYDNNPNDAHYGSFYIRYIFNDLLQITTRNNWLECFSKEWFDKLYLYNPNCLIIIKHNNF